MIHSRLWLALLVAGVLVPEVAALAKPKAKAKDAAASGADESLDPYGETAKVKSDKALEEGAPPDVLGGDPFTPSGDYEPDAGSGPALPQMDVGVGLKAAVDMGAELQHAALPAVPTAHKRPTNKHTKVDANDNVEARREEAAAKRAAATGPRYGTHDVDPTLGTHPVETVAAVAGADVGMPSAPAGDDAPVLEGEKNPGKRAKRASVTPSLFASEPAPAHHQSDPFSASAGATPKVAAVDYGKMTGGAEGRTDGGPTFRDIGADTGAMIGGVSTAAVADTFAPEPADAPAAAAPTRRAAQAPREVAVVDHYTPQGEGEEFDASGALADATPSAPIDREDDAAMALFGNVFDGGKGRVPEKDDEPMAQTSLASSYAAMTGAAAADSPVAGTAASAGTAAPVRTAAVAEQHTTAEDYAAMTGAAEPALADDAPAAGGAMPGVTRQLPVVDESVLAEDASPGVGARVVTAAAPAVASSTPSSPAAGAAGKGGLATVSKGHTVTRTTASMAGGAKPAAHGARAPSTVALAVRSSDLHAASVAGAIAAQDQPSTQRANDAAALGATLAAFACLGIAGMLLRRRKAPAPRRRDDA